MVRLRDLTLVRGELPTGPHNAITDVPGVRVGHTTLITGEGPLVPGSGPVRTGVTAIVPHAGNLFRDKVAGAVHTVNGFGKVMGFEQVRELGTIESPILLTNTLNVGLVTDALATYLLRDNPEIGVSTSSVNPLVGETNDGFLNDLRGRHVREQHVWQAIATAAGGPVAEGNVGAGTGTLCFNFKGGIGTASRQIFAGTLTVGALVQTNFGSRRQLRVLGVPIGAHFLDRLLPATLPDTPPDAAPGQGSIMVVLATDAPASPHLLKRMAKRAALGLARTGSIAEGSSGDFVIAFSTTNRTAHAMRPSDLHSGQRTLLEEDAWTVTALFTAVVETVEEAVLNALVAAETMIGRDNHIAHALPRDELERLLTDSLSW
ncbi:MAG TPA: P1 family peptidase [Ktedonobacterales bacterium]|jgi:D-aminopeptidase|nr:P1 family peptidase [Ktedonobacterales bacterium]